MISPPPRMGWRAWPCSAPRAARVLPVRFFPPVCAASSVPPPAAQPVDTGGAIARSLSAVHTGRCVSLFLRSCDPSSVCAALSPLPSPFSRASWYPACAAPHRSTPPARPRAPPALLGNGR